MNEKLKSDSGSSVKFAKDLSEKLKQKLKNNKKETVFLLIVVGIFTFWAFGKFNFSAQKNEKLYQAKVEKTQKIDDRLLTLKLDQKVKKLNIKPYHHQDSSIVNYSQTTFGDISKFVKSDGTVVSVPGKKTLVVLHKNDGSKLYLFYNYILKKVEE